MALDYTSLAAIALNLISENGSAWMLHRSTKGAYNPATLSEPLDSEQVFAAFAVLTDFTLSQKGDKAIVSGDKMLLVAASDLSVTPLPADKFVKNEDEWRVVNVKEIKPADLVIYYELQVRQ